MNPAYSLTSTPSRDREPPSPTRRERRNCRRSSPIKEPDIDPRCSRTRMPPTPKSNSVKSRSSMNISCLAIGIGLLTGTGFLGIGQDEGGVVGPAVKTRLTSRQDALLRLALKERRVVVPSRAVSAVRQFAGNPRLDVTVSAFADDAERLWDREWSYYGLTVEDPEWGGAYTVRATDGRLVAMSLHRRRTSNAVTAGPAAAREIAEAFAGRVYPRFRSGNWIRAYDDPATGEANEYRFCWSEVLNGYGTRAPHSLIVGVDAAEERVVTFSIPPDRITGPTVPRIAKERASRIALTLFGLDPAAAPLREGTLSLIESPIGIQRLWWSFAQQLPSGDGSFAGCQILVDAISGELAYSFSLGCGPPVGLRIQHPLRRAIVIRDSHGTPIASPIAPEVKENRLWVRAELLRSLGVRVAVTSGDATLRYEGTALSAEAVGSSRRDYGWWVPLAAVGRRFGWTIHWDSVRREASIAPIRRKRRAPM